MPLLTPADADVVKKHLANLTHPVGLLFFSQTFGEPETALATRQILAEVAELSTLVTVEEVNFVLDKDRTAAFGIPGIPAIALTRDGVDTRMRFLGAPSGYEFMSLIEAIIVAGSDEPGLSESTIQLIGEITEPIELKVFVTPTCPHCPRAVTLAHRMALASPLITATCVEAMEFMDLSRRFHVTGVPKTVVNETTEIMGALPENEFVAAVLGKEIQGSGQVS